VVSPRSERHSRPRRTDDIHSPPGRRMIRLSAHAARSELAQTGEWTACPSRQLCPLGDGSDELDARVDAEFSIGVAEVEFDRLGAQVELRGDFFVGLAFGDEV